MQRRALLLWGLRALAALAASPVSCRSRTHAGDSPTRVVSIAPSTTESVYALGSASALVGRSRFCDWPPEALKLPAVGGFADPSVEAIVALRPTLVVGARGPAGPALEATLRSEGIATFFPETETLAQIDAMLLELASLLGRPEDGRTLVARLAARRRNLEAQIAAHLGARRRPRAAFVFDTNPIVVAGPGSFTDELLGVAGAENVITKGGAYPTIGLEELIGLDPDVLIDGTEAAHGGRTLASMKQAPGLRELRAMREGRAPALSSSAALRPGPRIMAGVEDLAGLVLGPGFARGSG